MGSCVSRPNSSSQPQAGGDPPQAKVYSWDKRRTEGDIDASKYCVSDLTDGVLIKQAGDVNGESFTISKCVRSTILIMDYCASVTIDDCSECKILIGPTKGSIYVRDSSNLQCAFICKQFRARDCKDIHSLTCCTSNPTLESSKYMTFACLMLSYDGLQEQLTAAGINPFDNMWYEVYDFCPSGNPAEQWSLEQMTTEEETKMMLRAMKEVEPFHLTTNYKSSLIPYILGYQPEPPLERCLVVFCDAMSHSVIRFMHQFLQHAAQQDIYEVAVIKSKSATLSMDDCKRLFEGMTKTELSSASKGQVIGMEVHGRDCTEWCIANLEQLQEAEPQDAKTKTNYLVVSDSDEAPTVDRFFNFTHVMMSS